MEQVFLEEYKDISANLRERHTTIWHARNIYILIMLALVGLTYQFTSQPGSTAASTLLLVICGLAVTSTMIVIEIRYAKTVKALLSRLTTLETHGLFEQFTAVTKLQSSHKVLFGKGALVIYCLLSIAFLGAMVARGFLVSHPPIPV